MASISEPFIRRPVGTTLLAIGLFLIQIVAYEFLPNSIEKEWRSRHDSNMRPTV